MAKGFLTLGFESHQIALSTDMHPLGLFYMSDYLSPLPRVTAVRDAIKNQRSLVDDDRMIINRFFVFSVWCKTDLPDRDILLLRLFYFA